MEGTVQTQRSSREMKRTWPRQLQFGGCRMGIKGLAVWGGTLAIAGLMAIITVRTTATRRKRGSESAMEDDGESTKGLGLVLLGGCKGSAVPTGPCHDQCCCIHTGGSKNGAANMDSFVPETMSPVNVKEMLTSKADRQGEPHTQQHQQQQQQEMLLFSDDSKPESIASCEDYSFGDWPVKGKTSKEVSPVSSGEQEEEEDIEPDEDCSMGDYNTEDGNESWEETESNSSSESNSEAGWQVRSFNRAFPRFGEPKDTYIGVENISGEKYGTCCDWKIFGKEALLEKAPFKSHQTSLSKSANWVVLVGILLLLLLLPLLLSVLPWSIAETFYVVYNNASPVP